jgi:hypothetical protein
MLDGNGAVFNHGNYSMIKLIEMRVKRTKMNKGHVIKCNFFLRNNQVQIITTMLNIQR